MEKTVDNWLTLMRPQEETHRVSHMLHAVEERTRLIFLFLASCAIVACVAFGLRLAENAFRPLQVSAAAPLYDASIISINVPTRLAPGQVSTVTVTAKNIGTGSWNRDGKAFFSIYRWDPFKKIEKNSVFATTGWQTPSRAARLDVISVSPGKEAIFSFLIKAPNASGRYTEDFILTIENTAWMKNGRFQLQIDVGNASTVAIPLVKPPVAPAPSPVPTPSSVYQATLLLRSLKELVLSGGGNQEITLGFKNTGQNVWQTRTVRMTSVQPFVSSKLSSVRADSWPTTIDAVVVQGAINPGEIGFVTFRVKAPIKQGAYRASFQLQADGNPVSGGEIDIPITVTADGYIEPDPVIQPPSSPSSPTPLPLTGDIFSLPDEPIIRVGIFKTTDDQMIIRALTTPLSVIQSGQALCRLTQGNTITIRFDRVYRVYQLSGTCQGQSSTPYLVRAEDSISPMEIADFSRPVGWLPGANDNTFRGQLELRYSPTTDNVWVINELPIEWYLRGIAETSDVSPWEYQKALLTAARTYAMYHVQRGTKHASEFFIVDASLDQVYRGYGAEARSPKIVAAVEATRGQIVTYNGSLAITPYYSRSDGRTRSWGEVWYGGSRYPWLVSVPVPWDEGKTLWGHGVGLSASGALAAARDGWLYDRILSYFYTGIELRRAYK